MIKLSIKIVISILLFVLMFFAIQRGVANYYADERNHEASVDDLETAITWNSNHPYALGMLAEQYLQQHNYSQAEELAFKSLVNNPTYGVPASVIIATANQKKNDDVAAKATDFTQKLWPANVAVQKEVVIYWLKKDRVDKVLPAWNVILSQSPQASQKLFPILFKLSQNPAGLASLKPYAKKPSVWWSRFFVFLTRQKDNLDSLQKLYQMRLESEEPLTNIERSQYIERLVRDKQWVTAYFSWLSGLEKEHQQYTQTLLYDGGFESELHNTGFDWYYSPNKIVSIEPSITRGMHGRAALRVDFKKRERINFKNVSQRLFLPAGDYALEFRSRVDRLRTEKGLKWRIRCLGDQNNILGESHSLLGFSSWKTESFYFTVPDIKNCQAQLLRLEASSPYIHHHLFSGTLWFDDMRIIKKKRPDEIIKDNDKKKEEKNEK